MRRAGSSRRGMLVASMAGAVLPRLGLAQNEPGLGELLPARLASQGVGYSLAEVQGSQVRVHHAGLARREPAEPIGDDSLYEIGSITKTFTALLLADAVVRKELALTDAVEPSLPDKLSLRDAAGEPLRWIDLATHRSGLPRLAANMLARDPADPYADYGAEHLTLFLRGWKPTRRRGEVFAYSNLGFGLLGQALAWRAGLSYDMLLSQRVLQPLALDGLVRQPTARQRRVTGHDAQGRPVADWHFTDVHAGAGALLGTAASLARYAQAALGVFDHPLKEAFALCLRRHADGGAPINPIGLAWVLAPLNGRTVFNHDGATFGCSSSLWLDPQRQRAALVLANAAVKVSDLALHVLDRSVPAEDLTSTRQAARSVAASEMLPLAGVYALTPQFKLTIRAQEDRLFAQATGQGEFELFGKGGRVFFARVTPLEIAFDGEVGPPQALTLKQGGQSLRFVREAANR